MLVVPQPEGFKAEQRSCSGAFNNLYTCEKTQMLQVVVIQEGVLLINVRLAPGTDREVISASMKPDTRALFPLLSHTRGGERHSGRVTVRRIIRRQEDTSLNPQHDWCTVTLCSPAAGKMVTTLAGMCTLACSYPRLTLLTSDGIDWKMQRVLIRYQMKSNFSAIFTPLPNLKHLTSGFSDVMEVE